MAFLTQTLCIFFIVGGSVGFTDKFIGNNQEFLFVSYGHSVQINCSLTESDVNVTLYVKRFNTPPRKIEIDNVKWRLNKGLFTITVTEPLDGGQYICETVNKTGQKRTSKQVTVIPVVARTRDKFKVEVTPPSMSLQYEDNANVSCSALGKRKLKWYKVSADGKTTAVDKKQLIDDDHYDTDGGSRIYHSRLILSIKHATKEHAGRYKCIAKSNRKRLEAFVVVSVRDPKKPLIRNFPPIVIASEGISVTVKCKAKGSPRPKITWYKDDKLLGICEGGKSRKCRLFSKIQAVLRKNSLTLHKLSYAKHNGKYTCEVANFMGTYSASSQVTIFSKPVLSKRLDTNFHKVVPVLLNRGNRAVLRCNIASGYPRPEIAWEYQSSHCLTLSFACKPGEDWKLIDNWTKKRNEFVVEPPFGAGFYRCVATNMVGKDHQIFAVRKEQNGSTRRFR